MNKREMNRIANEVAERAYDQFLENVSEMIMDELPYSEDDGYSNLDFEGINNLVIAKLIKKLK